MTPTRLSHLSITWQDRRPKTPTLVWAQADTPYGSAIGVASELGLCALGFAGDIGADRCRNDLMARWPDATWREDPARIAPLVAQAIDLRGALHVMGTPFQIRVWQALLALPLTGTATYGDIAQAIGSPRAAQAVGSAVGANPLSVVIPCHRIVPKSGGIGAYHWGSCIKAAILEREATHFGPN